MRTHSPGTSFRYLAWPGHLLAWAMVVFPLSAVVLTALVPGGMGTGAFGRTRALGVLVEAMLSPLVGIFLGAFLAEYFGQRSLRIVYTVFSAITGVATLLAAPLFILDALVVRGGIQEDMRRLYDLNMLRGSLLFLAVSGFLLLLAGLTGRALLRERRERTARAATGRTLVSAVART